MNDVIKALTKVISNVRSVSSVPDAHELYTHDTIF